MTREAPSLAEAIDPWERVQIDPAARLLAERAASVAGLTVEEWLERAIRRACLGASPAAPAPALIAAPPKAEAPPAPEARQEHEKAATPEVARSQNAEAPRHWPKVAQLNFQPWMTDALAQTEKSYTRRHSRQRRWLWIAAGVVLAIVAGAVSAQFLIPSGPRHVSGTPPSAAIAVPPAPAPAPVAIATTAVPVEPSSLPVAIAALPAPAPPASALPVPQENAEAATPAPTPAAAKSDPAEPPESQPKELATWLEARAQRGDAMAQYRLGLLYALGEGVVQDYQHAAQLFRTAAEAGLAEAQYNVAVMYGEGVGVERNVSEAIRWYRKAAAQGSGNAAFNLGVAYASGVGVERSMEEAARWFRRAASEGVVNGQFNLGLLYERGDGVPVSQIEAYAWYAVAASQGDAGATQRRDRLASSFSPSELKAAEARTAQLRQEIAKASAVATAKASTTTRP